MLKAIIFDMDGVLVDTEPLHYKVNVMILEELGYKLEYEYYKQFIGSTPTYMCQSICNKYELDLSPEQLKSIMDSTKDEVVKKEGFPKIDGVRDMIIRLAEAGFKMAVASSSPSKYIEQVVEALDIKQYFDFIISGETVQHPKPAPDIFLKAAQMLKVNPTECVVVEDSQNGVRAAKAANITCIGFMNPNSGDQDLSLADYIIEDYSCVDKNFVEKIYTHAI